MSPHPDIPSVLNTIPDRTTERRYERPVRSGHLGRARPLLELPLFLVLALVSTVVVVVVGVVATAGIDTDVAGTAAVPLSLLATDLGATAVLLPAVALTVRWAGGRRLGSVSSTAGRLRWHWLGSCVPPALVLVSLLAAVAVAQDPSWDPARWPGWGTYVGLAAGTLLLVPLQAAAEEYLTRGWLVQTLAVWTRFRWGAAAPAVVLFVALHDTVDPWAVADLSVFAIGCCWLTFRTGGLEAAIVLHTVTNVVIMLVLGLQGVPATDLGYPDLTAVDAIASMTVTVLYAWWIAVRADRRRP